jgi:hypothetical protein
MIPVLPIFQLLFLKILENLVLFNTRTTGSKLLMIKKLFYRGSGNKMLAIPGI